ncbi:glutamine synthetase (plasmid) [Natrialba magadii ATCC 43099]|uniref:Glutamate--ammonia ligase n=1 Tax=Natrialba magadii (strain ATCC 43099 / DSM 3394 / CCM 3739 / CIP 104546 / IAM 13178 / JCM 8861 / NBRC 102185 / NCIMB 2190 / MS3) TaxID=547559 RepID=D3T1D2_NATMM|nr:glutamine synthetase family protein [Natrialba magadii]ADD07391.1 glutamine synthetase [Natrialba magadii ATCC 43099]ELY32415.1 glutamate--ammonia ligase [Natrialba magadii ATCC 43099]
MTDTEARLESMVQADDINHVFIEFPDLNGLSRSKQLDADYFLDSWEDGFTMNLALLTQTPRSDVVEGSKYGDEIDYADALVHPDPRTCRRVPWRDDAVRVICDFEFRGQSVPGAPRTVLQSVAEQITEFGLDASVGSELECFLLESVGEVGNSNGSDEMRAGTQTGTNYVPATSDKHENLTRATEEVSPFYDCVYDWASAFGLDLTTVHHEFGAGQIEILFKHGDPLGQADRTFRFKELVKHAATACDQHATFMAKPFTDRAGSGYHLHVSLFDDGENVLEGTDGDLSEQGRHFVGGLLEHADALAALGTPNLNGFKRYQPGTFAPYSASWGYGNRMTAIRVPGHGTTRVENRISSADANPYLVVAATLAAGLHGLEAELEPPAPSEGDPSGSRPTLPQSPREAIVRLEADEVLTEYLGEDVVSEYAAQKRHEIERFYSQTTAWERDEYIEIL